MYIVGMYPGINSTGVYIVYIYFIIKTNLNDFN